MAENFVYAPEGGCDGKPGDFLIRSAIPGNIGILKASFKIWDNNPIDARPTQIKSFSFTQGLDRDRAKQDYPDVEFLDVTNQTTVHLSPECVYNDMFICANYPLPRSATPFKDKNNQPSFRLEFVGGNLSPGSVFIKDKLPGGTIYLNNGLPAEVFENGQFVIKSYPDTGRDIFPHQVWVHTGSLIDPVIYFYPSEYNLKPEATLAFQFLKDKRLLVLDATAPTDEGLYRKMEAAPKWSYDRENIGDREGVISPVQITKNAPGNKETTQWTLEKYTPLWQGEDLLITITVNDKGPDKPIDPATTQEILDGIDVLNPEYVYLMYKWKAGYKRTYSGQGYQNSSNNQASKDLLIHGISNEAFFVPSRPSSEENGTSTNTTSKDPILEADELARSRYWWKYNNYILVELGAGHYFHNYFIEFVYGRKPRFLHLGEEWDTPLRVNPPNLDNLSSKQQWASSWTWIRKCRALSEFQAATTDAIFNKKGPIRFHVRSHIGYIVITFEGMENDPWIIVRQDTVPNQHYENENNRTKEFVPMVIPNGIMKIHGGNLSCKINVSPLRYTPYAAIDFQDLQFDSIQAKDEDLYMTFAHLGNSNRYKTAGDFARKQWFNDTRIEELPIGFDVDAYTCVEVNKNKKLEIPIYETFSELYGIHGKGWVTDRPRDTDGSVKKDGDTNLPLPVGQISFLKPGEEHKVHIFNMGNSGKPQLGFADQIVVFFGTQNLGYHFDFGLKDVYEGEHDFKDYLSVWNVGIGLESGTILYPPYEDLFKPIDVAAKAATFPNVVTPIAKSWRVMFLGGVDALADTPSFDIAPIVTSFSEEWTGEEMFYLEHSANVSAYIPVPGTPYMLDDTGNLLDIASLGQRLYSLIDKTFFISISYWWDSGIGIKQSPNNIFNPPSSKDDPLLIQMTGLAHGGSVNITNNMMEFSFKVHDYKKILNDQFILNSPFFDANSDVSAVYILAQMAGFKADDGRTVKGINRSPLSFLKKAIKREEQGIPSGSIFHNGEKSRFKSFALPGSYVDVVQPAMKFENGKTYILAIQEIAELAAKTFYFDRWGVIRFEYIPSILAAFLGKDDDIEPVMRFTTSPFNRRASGGQGSESNSLFVFDPTKHAAHLVFNAVVYTRSVEDCINQISIFSAGTDLTRDSENRPQGGFISEGYTFYDQLYNPNAEGFIGYKKPGFNMNGLYGGVQEVREALKTYSKMKYPPVEISFECFGVPGLKALDIVTLDNNLLWIKEIKHDINPSENKWWMTISGEWYKPFKGDLDFLQRSDDAFLDPSDFYNASDAPDVGPGGSENPLP